MYEVTPIKSGKNTSLGTWARTVASLSPKQIAGRPSFWLRRQIAPRLARSLSTPTQTAAHRIKAPVPPPMIHLDADDLGALDGGILRLFGQASALEDAARHTDPLFRYAVHELSWIHAAIASEHASPALRSRLRRWLSSYLATLPDTADDYWDPFPLSSRILNAGPLIDIGATSAREILPCVARWWRALVGLAETHLGANHLLRNRCAAVCAARLLGRTGELHRVTRLLVAEARRQFLDDGTHEERTPGYHWQACRDLIISWSCVAESSPYREPLAQICEAALLAMDAMTHEDGRLTAFGDTAPMSLPVASTLRSWAADLGLTTSVAIPERHEDIARTTLAHGGFTMLRAGALAIYVNHGELGARHQPGHAHCDLMAIEVDFQGRRIIVDPGVHSYHDPPWREITRASREHSTPSVDGHEQAEIWSRFRCGWRPRDLRAVWNPQPDGWRFAGEAIAFGPATPRRLRREIAVSNSGCEVRDEVVGTTSFSIALTLAPGHRLERQADGYAVEIDGARILIRTRAGGIAVEPAYVSHRFGAREPTRRLRLHPTSGSALMWSIAPAS